MSATSPGRARLLALPAAAIVLVAGVLGAEIAQDGGRFEPLEPADPCAERTVSSTADGLDGLTERLVLLGLDGAACRLGVTREALTLELAQQPEPTAEQVDALRAGLLDAVEQLAADDSLPPISDLVDDALDRTDLGSVPEAAIRAVPDVVVDAVLKTDDVLVRTVDELDLREVLTQLDDRQDLDRQLDAAVTQAVQDALLDRLRELLPG